MLLKGMKVRLTKAYPSVPIDPGTEFTVTDVSESGVVTICNGTLGYGVLTMPEFEGYFEIIPEVKRKPWTDWISVPEKEMVGQEPSFWEYKTNGRNLVLRVHTGTDTYKARACCAPGDEFDLKVGLKIANARIHLKCAQDHYNAVISKYKGD